MDDLDWLDELPDEWQPPDELQRPTRVPFINFVLLVLASEKCSNAIAKCVAELLVAKEKFTMWYASDGKQSLGERRLLELSTISGNLLQPCWEAWQEYRTQSPWTDVGYLRLLNTWNGIRNQYNELIDSRPGG